MGFVQFRLLDRKTDLNSFFQNANGTKDHDKKLDYTNSYGVLNPYFIYGKEGERKVQQYITGCPIFDPLEQKKQEIKPTLANSRVAFEKGAPILLDEKKGAILIKWLRDHPFNPGSIHHDPEKHEAAFYEYDPKAELKNEVKVASDADEALEMLFKIKKDPARMRAIAPLFAETMGLSEDGEIYLGLREIAQNNPETFLSSIGTMEGQVLSDILLSEKLNIIGKDAKGWFYEGVNGGTLFATTTKNRKDTQTELVQFLMSREGEVHYRNLLVKKQHKEIDESAPVGLMPNPEDKFKDSGQLIPPGE